MLKLGRHSELQSYFNCVFGAFKRLKHKIYTNRKPELSHTFCESQARIQPESPGRPITPLWVIHYCIETLGLAIKNIIS